MGATAEQGKDPDNKLNRWEVGGEAQEQAVSTDAEGGWGLLSNCSAPGNSSLGLFRKHLWKSSLCIPSPWKAPACDDPYLHQVKPRAHLASSTMSDALLCGGAACLATAPAGTGSPGQDLQRIPGLCNWRLSL